MKSNRNYWPLGIISAFVVFIAGTAGLVVLACSSRSDLVAADYYEQELRFQGRLDGTTRAKKLDQPASVTYETASKRIVISLPTEHARQNVTGTVQLYRPSAAGLDQRLKLEVNVAGTQTIDASSLLPGLWKVRVQWTAQNKDYFVDESIVIGRDDPRRTGVAPVSNFKSREYDSGESSQNGSNVAKTEAFILETGATPVLR